MPHYPKKKFKEYDTQDSQLLAKTTNISFPLFSNFKLAIAIDEHQ